MDLILRQLAELQKVYTHVPYSRKLSREKIFTKFGGVVSFGGDTSEQFAKVFCVKILFSANLRKFCPSKVSRYTVSVCYATSNEATVSTYQIYTVIQNVRHVLGLHDYLTQETSLLSFQAGAVITLGEREGLDKGE